MLNRFRSKSIVRHVSHQEGAAILNVSVLTASYNGKVALEDLSFRLNIGERVVVVGPNRAGKSTLFKIVAGVMSTSGGDVKVFGYGPGQHLCISYVPDSAARWNGCSQSPL